MNTIAVRVEMMVLEFGILYTSDSLWNGEGCEKNDSCCDDAIFPCQFPAAKQEDVEVRSCHDQSINDEVVLINQLQLFMQSELTLCDQCIHSFSPNRHA